MIAAQNIKRDAAGVAHVVGHTFRTDTRDTWPAGLKQLRTLFQMGVKPTISLKMMEARKGMCRACSL